MCSCQMFFKDCRVTLDNDRKLMTRMTNLSFQASGSTRGSYTGIYVQNRLSYNRGLSLARVFNLNANENLVCTSREFWHLFFTFVCWNCTLPKLRKTCGLKTRSVPVSCCKFCTPMNIWFARASSPA